MLQLTKSQAEAAIGQYGGFFVSPTNPAIGADFGKKVLKMSAAEVAAYIDSSNLFLMDVAYLPVKAQVDIVVEIVEKSDGYELDIAELAPAVQTEINRKLQEVKKQK